MDHRLLNIQIGNSPKSLIFRDLRAYDRIVCVIRYYYSREIT